MMTAQTKLFPKWTAPNWTDGPSRSTKPKTSRPEVAVAAAVAVVAAAVAVAADTAAVAAVAVVATVGNLYRR